MLTHKKERMLEYWKYDSKYLHCIVFEMFLISKFTFWCSFFLGYIFQQSDKTRLKRLSVLDREIRYILGLFETFETVGTVWHFWYCLRLLGLFETYWDLLRLLRLFETFGTFWDFLDLLGRFETFEEIKIVLWH